MPPFIHQGYFAELTQDLAADAPLVDVHMKQQTRFYDVSFPYFCMTTPEMTSVNDTLGLKFCNL